MNKELKRNITAFLLAAGMLLLGVGGIYLIILIGVLLGASLPYVVASTLLFGLVWMISIPIRDILEQKELSKEYQKRKDEKHEREARLKDMMENDQKLGLYDFDLDEDDKHQIG
jgi:uncharacterized membrane protein SpoIIM required for sporulation